MLAVCTDHYLWGHIQEVKTPPHPAHSRCGCIHEDRRALPRQTSSDSRLTRALQEGPGLEQVGAQGSTDLVVTCGLWKARVDFMCNHLSPLVFLTLTGIFAGSRALVFPTRTAQRGASRG